MKSWSSANSTVSAGVVVAGRLEHHEEVVVVHLELGPLVGGDGVLHRQLVQPELLAHRLELLVGGLVQPDPHEAVRLASRPRGPARAGARRPGACRRCRRRSPRSPAHLPPRVAGSRPWTPPPTSPTCRPTRPGCSRGTATIRTRPCPTLPAAGTARRSSTTSPAPTRGSAPRWSTGPSERVRFKQSPQAPEGDELPGWFEANVAGLVRGALGRWTPTSHWPTWAGDRAGSFYPRRMAQETAVHRWDGVGGRHRPRRSRSTASTSTSSCSRPWRPGDSAPRARHDPPARHRHRRRVARHPRPGGDLLRARPRQGRRRAPRRAGDLLLWAWNRVPVDDRFEVFGDPRPLDAWRAGVAI